MLPTVILPTLLWMGQISGLVPAAPQPPGLPDYARAVRAARGAVVPEDPVLGCIHRPAELPYDKAALDLAARRILQIIKLSRLREAQAITQLGPPAEPKRRLVPRRPPSRQELRHREALAEAIDRHWEYFEARVYEVRMFRHRPREGMQAARRAAGAWDALLSLFQQYPEPLPPDLDDEFTAVDGWVGVFRRAGA